jgi:hypothetical protein
MWERSRTPGPRSAARFTKGDHSPEQVLILPNGNEDYDQCRAGPSPTMTSVGAFKPPGRLLVPPALAARTSPPGTHTREHMGSGGLTSIIIGLTR